MGSRGFAEGDIMKDTGDFIEIPQAKTIMNTCIKPRDKLLFHVLINTGRRVSEALLLKPRNINFDKQWIYWKILKRKKDYYRWIVTNKNLIDHIARYIDNNGIGDDEFVFSSTHRKGKPITRIRVYQIVKKWCNKAGVNTFSGRQIHPHTFRHSFCVWNARRLKSPRDLIILKELMGHASIQTTYQYLHVTQREIKDLVNSYDDLLKLGEDDLSDDEFKKPEGFDFTKIGEDTIIDL